MVEHIVIEKIPGKQRGFNYVVECPVCHVRFKIKGCHFNNGQRVFCSMRCRGMFLYNPDKLNNFINGRYKKSGYWIITTPNGPIYEHRYVMEQKLGRKLDRYEFVHHIDGNRLNNNPDNLELMTSSEHSRHHRVNSIRERDSLGRFI